VMPNHQRRAAVEAKAEEIRAAVERECRVAKLVAEVRLDGSVAKDTWVRDYADVDIFMRVSPELSKIQLKEICLPIAKRALYPAKTVERFAEHPYVEANVAFGKTEMLRVNVVPCYEVEKGNWLSATDRSPYHTEYIRSHLTVPQHDEVRLLKAFMRGIGAYGADIKTGGFSGMLCETLIASQGDFRKVLMKFSTWEESKFIDIENYFSGRSDELRRLFREPLIVVDPVDKGRNLAAAVRREQLWNFVAASRQLIAKPSARFFQEPKVKAISTSAYRKQVEHRKSAIIAVVMGRMDVVVDVLWSQLYRTERAIEKLLENNDFSVIRSASWSDERSLNVILLELEHGNLPESRKHLGPPVSRMNESASFIAKHLRESDTVSGPWIENDRWVVQKERDFKLATELLRNALSTGGRTIGVASEPARAMRKRMEVLSGYAIARLIDRNAGFAMFMNVFLTGRPSWLG